MDKNYRNYHKHSTKSSGFTPDTHIQQEEYFKRAKELGHDAVFTTEHGFGGSVFESLDFQEKYGIKAIYAMEIYMVKNHILKIDENGKEVKDRSNYHMIIVAKNNRGRRQMNLQNSIANEFQFYYKPRWTLNQILELNPKDFFVTTACVAGIARDIESVKEICIPIMNHFKENFFWEVQSHNHDVQIKLNKLILECQKKYGGKIIHANDSHYIYPNQHEDKANYLKGKKVPYGDEDSFILDYPDYDTIVKRYKEQGVLSGFQIKECLKNTLFIDSDELIDIDKSIKMPTIDEDLSLNDRHKKLIKLVNEGWKAKRKNIDKDKWKDYLEALKFELNIVKETNDVVRTSDYFLMNKKIVDTAINKHGGVLTKTGRGSASSFLMNNMLELTSIDRLALDVPMYPTRFLSKSRLLETRSLPDFDFNVKDPEPFVNATKEVLGENHCYWMVSYGTLQESGAFKNTCRVEGIDFDLSNKVSQDLDSYRENEIWKPLIEKSKPQIGAIDSISRSPGSALIMNEDIREEIGLIRSGDDICACITSMEVEDWKYLKNDYLTVTVVEINDDVYKRIGIKQHEISELIELLDDKVWDIYEKGITRTLNQVSTDNGMRQVKILKPRTYSELSAFVAAIRPGFASLVDTFLHRKEFTNEIDALDELLEASNKFMLYQESVMQFLVWLGIEEDVTYGIVKKISKKKFKEEELIELKSILLKNWIQQIGSEEGFDKAWKIVEDNSKYSFNSAHAVSVAFDSLYGAYLKSHYPLEYYEVVFNRYSGNTKMIGNLTEELKYFDIKINGIEFGKSHAEYRLDKETNSIYKGIASIKQCGIKIADELDELYRSKKYTDFIALLDDIKYNTSVQEDQLDGLIMLNFFKQFGKNQYLLDIKNFYYSMLSASKDSKYRKQFNQKNIEELNLDELIIIKNSKTKTEKLYKDLDIENIIREHCAKFENKGMSLKNQIINEKKYLGYINFKSEKLSPKYYFVDEFKVYKNKAKPYLDLYQIRTGEIVKYKIKNDKLFMASPFKEECIIEILDEKQEYAKKMVDGKWVTNKDKMNNIILNYNVY